MGGISGVRAMYVEGTPVYYFRSAWSMFKTTSQVVRTAAFGVYSTISVYFCEIFRTLRLCILVVLWNYCVVGKTGDGQAGKVVRFVCEGCRFESSHRRLASSPLVNLCWPLAPSWKWCTSSLHLQMKWKGWKMLSKFTSSLAVGHWNEKVWELTNNF